MRFDPLQLQTLVRIVDLGTFEAAAQSLQITPSAASQRIRQLERVAGQVLVTRGQPSRPTAAGEQLVRLGRHWEVVENEALRALGDVAEVSLAVALNADSLATWLRPLLATIAERESLAVQVTVEDQGFTDRLLRAGEVVATVTSDPTPVQGCRSQALGAMVYQPMAAPALIARHRSGRGVDWAAMPMVVFNEKDRLQDEALAGRGLSRPRVVHRIPTSADFVAALEAGLGWGMLPAVQARASVAERRLQRIPGGQPLRVPLFWKRWRLDSVELDWLTAEVRRCARRLERPSTMAPEDS